MGGARARSGLRGGLCGLSQVRIQRRVGEHPNIVYMKELVETPDRSCPKGRMNQTKGRMNQTPTGPAHVAAGKHKRMKQATDSGPRPVLTM